MTQRFPYALYALALRQLDDLRCFSLCVDIIAKMFCILIDQNSLIMSVYNRQTQCDKQFILYDITSYFVSVRESPIT